MLNKLVVPVLALGWSCLGAGTSPGQDPEELPPPTPRGAVLPEPVPSAPCGPEGCAGHVRTIPVREVHLIERQKAVPVPELRLRDDVCRSLTTGLEIEWKEEQRVLPSVELKARVVEQPVTCYTTRLVEEVDPCTGKCCKVYKQVPEVKMVPVTVYDAIPVERVYVVRTPCPKLVPKELVVRRLALEVNTVPGVVKKLEGVFLENEVAVSPPPHLPLPEKVCLPPPAPVPPLPPRPCTGLHGP
jgi:hypothetical protein